MFVGEFRRPLAALEGARLIKVHLHSKALGGGGALKWPLKGGSRLIEVATTVGLTV